MLERKYEEKDGEEVETVVLQNSYGVGKSLGDPEKNFNTPL